MVNVSDRSSRLGRQAVFLSSSIPDPIRWSGEFDALEITDAVVAVARAVLTAGAKLVTGVRPTIAPLLLYVASELPKVPEPQVLVYQSEVFASVMPEATQRFIDEGYGELVFTDRVGAEPPIPGQAPLSLALMRRRMIEQTRPAGAVFIGGMAGISEEMRVFTEVLPNRPTYALGHPGGEAQRLAQEARGELAEPLLRGTVYPTLGRLIVDDLEVRNLGGPDDPPAVFPPLR